MVTNDVFLESQSSLSENGQKKCPKFKNPKYFLEQNP
jgi:hypothetical protein